MLYHNHPWVAVNSQYKRHLSRQGELCRWRQHSLPDQVRTDEQDIKGSNAAMLPNSNSKLDNISYIQVQTKFHIFRFTFQQHPTRCPSQVITEKEQSPKKLISDSTADTNLSLVDVSCCTISSLCHFLLLAESGFILAQLYNQHLRLTFLYLHPSRFKGQASLQNSVSHLNLGLDSKFLGESETEKRHPRCAIITVLDQPSLVHLFVKIGWRSKSVVQNKSSNVSNLPCV